LTLHVPKTSSNLAEWVRRAADAINSVIAQVGTGFPLTDGDKGDIVVTGSGAVWSLDVVACRTALSITNVENKSSATIRGEITSGNVTAALGFTPYNATNPSGYISGITSLMVTTALGYTPTSVTGLTGTQTVAAFKTGLSLVKGDVGLGSVDNTADAAKNVLTATKLVTARTIAVSGKATGTATSFDGSANITIPLTAVTLVAGDIPTIAQSQVTSLVSDLAAKAPISNPSFTTGMTVTVAANSTLGLVANDGTNTIIFSPSNGGTGIPWLGTVATNYLDIGLSYGTTIAIRSTGVIITGEAQCTTLRINATPTAAAPATTHHVPISINGVTYKLLLAS
jgi:hypothetical protein